MTYTPPSMIAVDEITRAAVEHCGTPFHRFLSSVLSMGRNTFELSDDDRGENRMPGIDRGKVPPMFYSYDSRPGGRDRPRIARLWARDLKIGENVRFTSRSTVLHSARTGSPGATYELPASLVISECEMPETIVTTLVGDHVSRVVAHPALEHPDLIITQIDRTDEGNIRIGLKSVRVNVGKTGRDMHPVQESGEFPLR